jgi:hypothetical protein
MQDMEDKDLETLFRECRVSDHRSSPRFDSDWDAARSRLALGRKTSFNHAIAAASIIVIVLVVAVVVRVAGRRSTIPQQNAGSQTPAQGASDLMGTRSAPAAEEAGAVLTPEFTGNSERNPEPIVAGAKKRARRQHLKPGQYPAPYEDRELLSTWRSPTEFLLRSPADDLLRAVPSIQDSMVRIDDR